MPPARQHTTAQYIIPYIDPYKPQWDSSPITKGLWVAALEEFLFTAERRFRTLVEKRVVLHTDGGGEFISREFEEFTTNEGVEHTTSPPCVSDLNGVAERAIRTVMEMVRAALVSSKFYSVTALYIGLHRTIMVSRGM